MEYTSIIHGNLIYANTDDISGNGKNYFPCISNYDYSRLLACELRYGGCTPVIAKRLPGSKFELVAGYGKVDRARFEGRKLISLLPADMDRNFLKYFAVENFLGLHKVIPVSLKAKLLAFKKQVLAENGFDEALLYEPKYETPEVIDRYVAASRLNAGLADLFDRGEFDVETAAHLACIPGYKQSDIYRRLTLDGKKIGKAEARALFESYMENPAAGEKDVSLFFTKDDRQDKKQSDESAVIKFARKMGFFPSDSTDREIESGVITLMEKHLKKAGQAERMN